PLPTLGGTRRRSSLDIGPTGPTGPGVYGRNAGPWSRFLRLPGRYPNLGDARRTRPREPVVDPPHQPVEGVNAGLLRGRAAPGRWTERVGPLGRGRLGAIGDLAPERRDPTGGEVGRVGAPEFPDELLVEGDGALRLAGPVEVLGRTQEDLGAGVGGS